MGELWTNHISFSQLSAVSECPYQYYLLKIVGVDPAPNAFAQAGTLAHSLLAAWARGELSIKELPAQWTEQYGKTVTAELPRFLATKGYATKLFDSILKYFEAFDGFPGYEIVGAEKEFQSSIAGEHFVGVIDLILRHKITGALMLVDHKSCSMGSFKKSKEQMYRQLLLYSKYLADTYGEFPQTLRFNLYKENLYDERPFDREDYIAARIWAETIIEEMKTKDISDWLEVRPEFFRCTNLASCRMHCVFGNPENHKRKDDIIGTKRTPTVA